MLDDVSTDTMDKAVHSVAHGVIRLEALAPSYGAEVQISGAEVQVFPRLVATEHKTRFARTRLGSGNAELDLLLKGGV